MPVSKALGLSITVKGPWDLSRSTAVAQSRYAGKGAARNWAKNARRGSQIKSLVWYTTYKIWYTGIPHTTTRSLILLLETYRDTIVPLYLAVGVRLAFCPFSTTVPPSLLHLLDWRCTGTRIACVAATCILGEVSGALRRVSSPTNWCDSSDYDVEYNASPGDIEVLDNKLPESWRQRCTAHDVPVEKDGVAIDLPRTQL